MSPQSMILPHELNGLADSGLEKERAGQSSSGEMVWKHIHIIAAAEAHFV
jgi:hypothetical protein